MKKRFRERILNEKNVDTGKYRYVATKKGDHEKQWIEIQRLPIKDLNTTAAINGWETIEKIER